MKQKVFLKKGKFLNKFTGIKTLPSLKPNLTLVPYNNNFSRKQNRQRKLFDKVATTGTNCWIERMQMFLPRIWSHGIDSLSRILESSNNHSAWWILCGNNGCFVVRKMQLSIQFPLIWKCFLHGSARFFVKMMNFFQRITSTTCYKQCIVVILSRMGAHSMVAFVSTIFKQYACLLGIILFLHLFRYLGQC